MEKYFVAPSYSNATILSVDENTHKAYIEMPCPRCFGSGNYGPLSVFNGVCFECNGTRKIRKHVKAYTEKEYNAYLNSQERARERKVEQAKAKRDALQANSEANKAAKLAEFGYDPENPQVYLVVGENSYEIKDQLKENGFRFDRDLGWYNTHSEQVPAGFSLTSVPFDDLFDWDWFTRRISVKDDAKKVADAAKNAAAPKSNSEYVGEIKERLRDLQVVYVKSREVDGYYGVTTIYTFKTGENILTWFSSGKGLPQDINVGDSFLLTGTVKDHKEYNGVKQTVLTRCLVK